MLQFARQQVGKPFSNVGMARSLVYPRQSDNRSFYCAELVAAVLKAGGMLSADSNPGSATPHSLYKLYSKQAAATANPYTLRQSTTLSLNSVIGTRVATAMPVSVSQHSQHIQHIQNSQHNQHNQRSQHNQRRHSDSPPRASFRVLSNLPPLKSTNAGFQNLELSLTSLRG